MSGSRQILPIDVASPDRVAIRASSLWDFSTPSCLAGTQFSLTITHLGTGTFNLYAFTLIGFATLDGPTEIKAHSLRWLPGGNSSQRLAATRMVTVTTLGNGAHR